MNLKMLLGFIIYYLIIGAVYHFGSGYLSDSTTNLQISDAQYNASLENANTSAPGYVTGDSDFFTGVFGAIVSFLKTLAFLFFGIGLPSSTPSWFAWLFAIVETGVTILAIGLTTDAIHSG